MTVLPCHSGQRPRRAAQVASALSAALLCSCGGRVAPATTGAALTAPWQRTEAREACADFDLFRHAYFGDLHIHTRYSADAYIFGTRGDARDAYAFARGAPIPVADEREQQTRTATIDRPLDFAAVTDHAEYFGEVDLCSRPGSPVYDDALCQLLRQSEPPREQVIATVRWLSLLGSRDPRPSLDFCASPGVDCDAAAVSVWKEIQAAAEEAYDRTSACTFTSFIGYEHTTSPGGRHLHRNVIFRNDRVPDFPEGHLETAADGIPQGVWKAVERDCLQAGTGCDAVIIPHNSNLSGGEQWLDPIDAAEAQRRQDREPLAEIHQQKGNSECRFDRMVGYGSDTEDELCVFEQLPMAHELPGTPPPSIDAYPRRNMIRNVLKDGLQLEQRLGVNPFQFGFAGSTDTHNATGGNVAESGWEGGQGNNDASPGRQIADYVYRNPGGLAVVWAEENSRDAIFAALRRRETYATSGTRPIVRFFGGDLSGVSCERGDFVERAYKTGTPMGGVLGPVGDHRSLRFAVLAVKDPGTPQVPGTDLQRVQIVKGWVDRSGATHEKVFDVAGDAANGASVDPASCAPVGEGADELCAVWEDPEFDPSQRAFYYARVLENPTCRWSTLVCKSAGVDPFSSACSEQAARAGAEFANCCIRENDDPFLSPVVQERVWTSPIWYRPEGIGEVTGGISFGPPGSDVLELAVRLGQRPAGLDLARHDLQLRVSDDDEILRVVFPAGSLMPGNLSPPPPGLRMARFEVGPGGEAVLRLETAPRDLSRANRSTHAVQVELSGGSYRAIYTRFWEASGDRLAPVTGESEDQG